MNDSFSSAHTPSPDRDPELWKTAQKRAAFKYHLMTYVAVNIFFWILYYFTRQHDTQGFNDGFPWPVWPMMGWGIGLFFHYLSAYHHQSGLAEKEYEKLKNKK